MNTPELYLLSFGAAVAVIAFVYLAVIRRASATKGDDHG